MSWMDGRDPLSKTGRTGMVGIREHLLVLSRQPGMTICPIFVGLDIFMEDALTQARSRLQDMEEWALDISVDAGDVGVLPRFEYLVRDWSFDAIYLLRPRSPAPEPERPITIGRSRRCDLCIPHEWISKVHAAVIRESDPREPDVQDHCYITDMESRHGVLINGEPVPAGEMRHLDRNDIVTLGRTTLLFVDPHVQRLLIRGA